MNQSFSNSCAKVNLFFGNANVFGVPAAENLYLI